MGRDRDREERLAAALRENLRKRKMKRSATEEASPGPDQVRADDIGVENDTSSRA
jgi:hypothetical protein